jgi:hypothetical protein
VALGEELRATLGFVPGAIAVMGKWEPFTRPGRCLREVAARAAAAVAIAEALRGAVDPATAQLFQPRL